MTLYIAIAGANGRMGAALLAAANADSRFSVAGITTRTGDAPATAAANAETWIDFTTPAATVAALSALSQTKVRAAVIGTTGLTAARTLV